METTSTAPSPLAGKSVLICEDEALTFMHLARAFNRAGLRLVASASNGVEAVKLIKQYRPDIVTMDVHMPYMNGIEAIRRAVRDFDTCVVVVSAYADDDMKRQAREAGACAFIPKPIDTARLLAEIEQAIAKRESDQSPSSAAPAP